MRYKIVPPARDVAFLHAVADALPRVPRAVEDCCTRVRDRTDLAARDDARAYLTFCLALGLAGERDGDYYQAPDRPDDAAMAANFREHVYGARELLEALEGRPDPATAATLFEAAIEPAVPRWERHRHDDWESTWRERTEYLCEWAVVFDLAAAVDGGYRVADGR